ncbi:MAG: hypothetical protein F4138_07235 [Acidimicrobiia bacterium]|nr:hypothetical protein [Acidimicrobiia bacterium]MYC57854.1 hypothetical protein [Acidimicrobiia bacterium]MYG94755.1 hypothetical protein [Acidimicrobiia bacterium]MYI30223.1 hypothetical protein [Acidimicrobiia bacterium]
MVYDSRGTPDNFGCARGVLVAATATAALLWVRSVPTPLLAIIASLLGDLAVVLAITLGVDGTKTI